MAQETGTTKMNYEQAPTEILSTHPGPAGGQTPQGSPKRNTGLLIALVAGAVVAIGVLVAFLVWPSSKVASTSAEASVASDTTAPVAGEDTAATTVAEASGTDSSGTTGGQSGGGNSTGGSGSTATSAPKITKFSTPDTIDCHNGNSQNFTASWSTTNAVKVTISIDGPGVYNTYGPSGSVSLPFNCSSSHTFLLKAYGSDGKSVSKTVTLKPRNVQSSQPQNGNSNSNSGSGADDDQN